MAQFQPITSHLFVLRCRRKPSTPCRYRNKGDEVSHSSSVSWQTNRSSLRALRKCYGTSRAAASSTTTTDRDQEKGASENENDDTKEESELGDYLAVGNGWKVRRMVEEEDEIRKVAQIQGEAFHVPTLFFNDVFFRFFIAEVLSGLLYRLRNSPPDRYACLVAVPDTDDDTTVSKPEQELVGVVDVTVLRDPDVVRQLGGAREYLYVSGIAVSLNHRRKKVGTTLLKACESMSVLWGYDHLVLRAYEDDWGARTLYANAGYTVVSGDPSWMTLIGRKRRILMIKRRCPKQLIRL